MHCLGAGTVGQVSPNNFGGCGSVLSVVRALGVLVCEGRIQGPPRGYKEGPHCVPALQSAPNGHVCDKDNYLCDRYLVLIREITERVANGSYLCVEVVLCSDCPCGLIKSKSKHRVLSAPSVTSWQHSSEMLLEYWCIGVVSSKSPETMNSQGLYQAVRSRLHFSQVAAWWSRTNGFRPSYVATRIVQHTVGDEHLRKFRDTPIEHTFPLAGLGDGNSLKVSMWALPRMEDIPCLQCTLHPLQPDLPEANDGCARPSLPTKLLIPTDGGPSPSSSVLGDGKSAKGTATPPTFAAATGDSFVYYMSSFRSADLLDDRLKIACNKPGKHHCRCADDEDEVEVEVVPSGPVLPRPVSERKRRRSLPCGPPDPGAPIVSEHPTLPALREVAASSDPGLDGLARRFRAQLNIDERQEKRYKRAAAPPDDATHVPLDGPWLPEALGRATVKLVLNPLYESNVDKSKSRAAATTASATITSSTSTSTTVTSASAGGPEPAAPSGPDRDLNRLVSKLSFAQERESGEANAAAILDWMAPPVPAKCELRSRNCSLELSPREFDEVLAVLRARTPLAKRRIAKRREKLGEVQHQQHQQQQQQQQQTKPKDLGKADVLLGAILRPTTKEQPEATSAARSLEPGADPPSPGSGLNRRLSRLRQLFKQRQPSPQPDPRAKRRIDFATTTRPGKALEPEDEDEEARSDATLGTSAKAARTDAIFHSINGEKRVGGRAHERQRLDERCSKKSRGRRDLSPVWLGQGNDAGGCNGAATTETDVGEIVDRTVVPSAKDQERFRRSLENAASMVFHSRTGLPLTSSPAPLRRGSCCFDFDSSLNSVSSKRSALFELSTPPSPGAVSLEEGDRETESACDTEEVARRRLTSGNRPQSHALLGSFEESALNGRLEPVSTVHGFTAEIGASGSFCPKHRKLPVTVFFYTLGDNDKVSSPYLAHINLGKKGYQIPRMGTIQVTLLNPLGTVVKMFVVLYDLTDMPERSHTFLRQRTLRDKMLRYLIHLRFMSNKSGRIYLHTDVRMIICRKSDMDTASDFGSEPPKELRSYIHGPTNPKFSPRC